jgi:hypothetical protein
MIGQPYSRQPVPVAAACPVVRHGEGTLQRCASRLFANSDTTGRRVVVPPSPPARPAPVGAALPPPGVIVVLSCRGTLAEAAGSMAWVWAAGGTNLRKPRSEARATREHLDGEAPIQPGGSNGPRHAPAGPPPRYSGSGDDRSRAVGRGRRPGWRPPDNHLQPPGFDRAEDVGTSRTVFALGGGGNFGGGSGGHAHGLLEAGIVPDAVVGTSVGALNRAFLAGRPDLSAIEPLRELWASISRRDISR